MWPIGVLVLFLAHAVAFTPTLFFNFTIPHDSPLLEFERINGVNRWNVSYDGTPAASLQNGMLGLGESRHTTIEEFVDSGPTVTLHYAFSSVRLLGRITGTTAHGSQAGTRPYFFLDDRRGNRSLDDGVLAFANGDFGPHRASYSAASGFVEVYGAEVTTGVQSNASSFDEIPRTEFPFVVAGELNRAVRTPLGRNYTIQNTLGGGGGQAPLQVNAVSITGRDLFEIAVPPGTTFLILNGTVGPQQTQNYFITIEPTPPSWYWGDRSLNAFVLYGGSPYVKLVNLFSWPLDPAVLYTMSISVGNNADRMSLHSLSFFAGTPMVSGVAATTDTGGAGATDAPGAGSSGGKSKTNVGAIAGGIVGGVLALTTIAALIVFLLRRRRRAERRQQHHTSGPVDLFDDKDNTSFTPYPPLMKQSDSSPPAASEPTPASEPTRASEPTPQDTAPEVDAGRVPLERPPPTYDPRWEGEEGGRAFSAGRPGSPTATARSEVPAGSDKRRPLPSTPAAVAGGHDLPSVLSGPSGSKSGHGSPAQRAYGDMRDSLRQ